MPPGEQDINASQAGKPKKAKLVVDAAQAARVQRDFLTIKAAADAGQEDRPYFDLNHDDREASAHPSGYSWGGPDAVNGGIRARLEGWTGAGEQAIKGKNYRRFSPTFFLNAKGEISLIHPSGEMAVNQGGLVNRAAFKRIQPIWSKSSTDDEDPAKQQQEEENQMKSLLAVLAKQGLITAADVDEATAVSQVTAKLADINFAKSKTESELTTVNAKLGETEKKLGEVTEAHATSVVDGAIAAGRSPGQDEKVKAKWVGLIKADPTNASLLPEPNAALVKVVTAKGAKENASSAEGGNGDHPFLVKSREYATEHKTSEAFAVDALAHKEPAFYDEYRASFNLGIPVGSNK